MRKDVKVRKDFLKELFKPSCLGDIEKMGRICSPKHILKEGKEDCSYFFKCLDKAWYKWQNERPKIQ